MEWTRDAFAAPAATQDKPVRMSGAIIEAAGGLIAVVLCILGLSSVHPLVMAASATIAVGVSFLLSGGAAAMLGSRLVYSTRLFGTRAASDDAAAAGSLMEFVAGCIGILMGVVAVVGFYGMRPVAVALIAFGATLLFSLRSTTHVREFHASHAHRPGLWRMARTATGMQALFGVSVAVLGVLALVGINPVGIALSGALVAGASQLLSGSARAGCIATE
jgi:hypothetical protein